MSTKCGSGSAEYIVSRRGAFVGSCQVGTGRHPARHCGGRSDRAICQCYSTRVPFPNRALTLRGDGLRLGPVPGTLYLVATPIGHLDDITYRAVRVLRDAALIAAEDTRRTAGLLGHLGIQTPVVSFHAHNEHEREPGLVERLRAGESIAVVSDAGTPLVSDPGAGLVRAARAAGIRVEAVPGASAALTALVCSGLPADSFTFLGFVPGPRRGAGDLAAAGGGRASHRRLLRGAASRAGHPGGHGPHLRRSARSHSAAS